VDHVDVPHGVLKEPENSVGIVFKRRHADRPRGTRVIDSAITLSCVSVGGFRIRAHPTKFGFRPLTNYGVTNSLHAKKLEPQGRLAPQYDSMPESFYGHSQILGSDSCLWRTTTPNDHEVHVQDFRNAPAIGIGIGHRRGTEIQLRQT
jgi:hypothetical protein